MQLCRRGVIVLCCLFFLSQAAFSQVGGDITGRVLDSSNAAIARAEVSVIERNTNVRRSTTTSTTGDYTFILLQPGVYRVEVKASGFRPFIRDGVTVLTGSRAQADIQLQVGASDQSVIVNADAPLAQSQSSDIQTVISGNAIPAMPLNGRNFIQLGTLAPGVSLPPGTQLPRINGGRPRTNEYLFDGISALQPEPGQVAFFPIVDDIQEFTIQSNNVPAEFGRFNGGVVNLTTRSGSNQLHGSLYEFYRDKSLNARNYFVKAPTAKSNYQRHQYGGTLGFPVLRDRLFFFGDYQGQRQSIGILRTSTVPTVNQRAGIFTGLKSSSGSLIHIYDPTSTTYTNGSYVRKQFPNDVINIPFDSTATALLKRFPTPTNLTADTNNYTRVADDDDHQNQFDIRMDGTYGKHDQAFVRYSYFKDIDQPVTPFPDGSGAITGSVIGTNNVAGLSHVLGQQVVFHEAHTFGVGTLNDLRVGYTRRSNNIAGSTLADTASAALGIPGIPTNAAFNNALPLFTITNYQQLGPSASTFSNYQTGVWQFVDTVSHNIGAHALKAGLDYRWYQLNAIQPPNPTGSFAFTTTGTNQSGISNTGYALASFLLGQVDTFQIDLQQSTIRPRDHIEEYFAQDDWKLLHNLTLNLGARWTLHLPSTELNDQGAIFDLATQQLKYVGKDGNSRSARELHWGNVAPRVGFAYQMASKTVVRAGGGIVFIDQSGITTPFTVPQFPFIQNTAQKTLDSLNAAFTLSKGPSVSAIPLTADAGLGQSVYTVKRKLGSGYVQQWNLAIQREITHNFSIEIAYVGSRIVRVGIPDTNLNQLTKEQLALGSKLIATVDNPYYGQIPSSSSIGTKKISYAQSIKPYPRFLNVAAYRNNTGQTNYNGVEFKAEKRVSRGLSFLFSYTHSKLIDDASSVFSSTVLSSPNSSSLIAADTYNPRLERDSSTGDMPNVTTLSATYELPAGRGHAFAASGLPSKLLTGWAVNGIITLQSGMPVTVTQATNNNAFAGFVLQRPNIVGKVELPEKDRTPAKYFNTAAFAQAPQYTLGNASRNPVRGPAYRDGDVALVKHTSLPEKGQVEFRVEIFNLTNTPAFAQPNGSYGSSAFGSITSTVTDPRVVQLAVRIRK